MTLGPGGQKEWDVPELISPPPAWVTGYRGLWGLWARDPVSGENAPGGPMYDRFGKVRRAWYDPIGWAGLNKQVSPDRALDKAAKRRHAIHQRRQALAISVAEKSRELRDLGLEAEAVLQLPHMKGLYQTHQKKISELSSEIDRMRAELAADEALLEALELYEKRMEQGYKVEPRAHIRRAHKPTSAVSLRLGRIAEAWAAASIGLMLLALVAIVLFAQHYLLVGVVAMLSVVAVVEAAFRRRLGTLVGNFTNLLAFVAALVLLFEFFWQIVIGVILLTGAYIMWENLRELWT